MRPPSKCPRLGASPTPSACNAAPPSGAPAGCSRYQLDPQSSAPASILGDIHAPIDSSGPWRHAPGSPPHHPTCRIAAPLPPACLHCTPHSTHRTLTSDASTSAPMQSVASAFPSPLPLSLESPQMVLPSDHRSASDSLLLEPQHVYRFGPAAAPRCASDTSSPSTAHTNTA